MDTQLKNMAEHEDPRRPVIRSSGEFDIPLLREGTDAHAYFGWYASYGTLAEAEILRRNLPANLRFVTEFGAQSFPNLESCLRFMPADIKEIDFAALTARHGFQGDIMARWLPWREAESLAELVDMSQDYQAEINRYYIDRLRYHKYRPTGGIVPFSFIDAYPAILWSIIDYWRVPKRSYYAMRMAFSPQYVFSLIEPRVYCIDEPVDLPLFAVNDEHRTITNLQLNALLRDPSDYLLASLEHHFDLGADCLAQEIDRLRLTPKVAGRYSLELTLRGEFEEIRHTYWINVD
jgi:beta-mannosidase